MNNTLLLERLNQPDAFGFLAAILTTIAFIPQLIKTWKDKKAEDVSIYMLILFIIGVFLWIIYGYEMHAMPVIIANIITFILNLLILILKLTYEKEQESN